LLLYLLRNLSKFIRIIMIIIISNQTFYYNIIVKSMSPICNYISQIFENIMTTTMFSTIEVDITSETFIIKIVILEHFE